MKSNDKPFEERLAETLKMTEAQYRANNDSNFGINFYGGNMMILQLVSRTLLENTKNNDFGYGIHLSFDDSFPETIGELERFKNADFADKFQFHTWDGIPTYQLDLKNDKNEIIKMIKKVLEVVYEENPSEIEIEVF